MTHAIELTERIDGVYWHAAAILKLDLEPIVRTPLEELRFEIGGGAITRRVDAEVGPMDSGPTSLRVPLHWKASEHPNLFPVMDAELQISEVEGNHIELRLVGEYRTPLGAVGSVADALAGHRVAQKSLQGFLAEVARHLRAELVEHAERVWASGFEHVPEDRDEG
jgi:hypothetical protein